MDNYMDKGEKIIQQSDGGNRGVKKYKGKYTLIPPHGMNRVARWYELGAEKYGLRNWEKGLSPDECLECLIRHTEKYLDKWTDEDHLAAIIWNAFSLMHYEQHLDVNEVYKKLWDLSRDPNTDPVVLDNREKFPVKGEK